MRNGRIILWHILLTTILTVKDVCVGVDGFVVVHNYRSVPCSNHAVRNIDALDRAIITFKIRQEWHQYSHRTKLFESSQKVEQQEKSSSSTSDQINGKDDSSVSPIIVPSRVSWKFSYKSFFGQQHQYVQKLTQRYGNNFAMNRGKYVILNDVESIRDVLEVHNLPKAITVQRAYRTMFPPRGGILAAPWKRWIQERRMTTSSVMKVDSIMISRILNGTKPIIQLLDQASRTGTVLEMDHCFTALTLDIIGLVILGRSLHMSEKILNSEDKDVFVPFCTAMHTVEKYATEQASLPRLFFKLFQTSRKVKKARNIINDFLNECIQYRMNERRQQDNNNLPSDLLNVLLGAQDDGILSKDDVKAQLFVFLWAGHDTMAHTLTWMLYEISMNEQLQESLYEEVKDITNDDYDTDNMQNKFPLLDAVWKETNRLHPAAPMGPSRAVGKYPILIKQENGQLLKLPARVTISIPAYSLHRNAKYWPDPHEFKPERFLNENNNYKTRNPYTYIPFSAGPRNCIGARLARVEALIVMSSILRKYHVQNVEKVHPPREYTSLTLKPKNGIHFKFTLRE